MFDAVSLELMKIKIDKGDNASKIAKNKYEFIILSLHLSANYVLLINAEK